MVAAGMRQDGATEHGGMVSVERDSPAWERAWAALVATGRDPDDGWMLMYAETADVPGGLRFSFKNHSLCESSMADDPAYDGRTKYVYLPARNRR